MGTYKVAFCTCDNLETAKWLGELAVKQQLAACVNILPSVLSIYTWNNQVQQSNEVLMILKTPENLVEPLKELIISNHPYDVPEFITVDITSGHQPYLDWLSSSTKKAK
jgi:periplasmic divalent cation tolerance protein